jgi:hypothetical protein
MRRVVLLLLLVSIITLTKAQDIPVHFNNSGIYEFLDEMAASGYINTNAAVKPYSAKFIYTCLEEANKSIDLLTKRQRKELNFYLRQYSIFADGNQNPYTKDRKGNIITRDRLNLDFYPMVSIIRIRFSHFQSVQYGEFVSMLVVPTALCTPGEGLRLGLCWKVCHLR